ncbi:MAG: leucyl aminopeptidase family protein [Lysobacter spongiicola]|nr:leucyl aminopeptidase family protein [Lysobacter spongiicola]
MSLPHGLVNASPNALPLHLVDRSGMAAWRDAQPEAVRTWIEANGFEGAPGSVLLLPGDDGIRGAVVGTADPLDPYSYGQAPYALPPLTFKLTGVKDPAVAAAARLGWGLGAYRFDRYKQPPRQPAMLQVDAADEAVDAAISACTRVRDLVNTPTEHMGPDQLEQIACEIAERHGARIEVIGGEDLLAQNFPAIHAVGRASHRAPRLISVQWGDTSHPHVAIVGKGVCFDTGGLDLKAAAGMRNMKKDMGGAAHAIALAEWVMARRLPLRITLLVPAVENAVGPDAFRPGEVIQTRAGISVEIDNTDAEGRLVLCDALAYAGEQSPELLLDFATLTGAARVALGPDLPALYSNDDAVAAQWIECGVQQRDPLWRMPLWRPYWRYLTSSIADIANGGPSKMAGSVTAALYLERFVPAGQKWAHLDVYSWNDSDAPGRQAGGEAQGLRAAFAMLEARTRA